ncbi:hypothetical protein [Xanthomonas hortorum]|nr:hypothetical protein [Xanthomonas hortorum]
MPVSIAALGDRSKKHRTRQARITATASKDVRMQVRRISGVSQS